MERMKKRTIAMCAMLLGVLLFQTLFWKLAAVLCVILVGRGYIKRTPCAKWLCRGLVAACVLGLWLTSPRIRWNTSDRVRLIYQDGDCKPMNMPLHHWLLSTLFPEPEIMNVGLPVARYGGMLIPESVGESMAGWGLIKEFIHGQPIREFKSGYRNLESRGQFLASGVVSQAINTVGGNTSSAYVIGPKDFDGGKTYPVVVFLHGALGNWQLYQGLMLGLDDYVVISPSTHDLRGRWDGDDLHDIVTRQLSFLEALGYRIDRDNVHLVGLSNGAYFGCSEAVRHYAGDFRSVTFIVGGKTTDARHKREMHVYGRDDAACPGWLRGVDGKRATDDYLYFPCCGHYLLTYHPEETRQWLVERWKGMR